MCCVHRADILNDPNLVATVFAPTNDAFVKLEKSLGYTQEQLLNSNILKPTLLYHVVPKVAAQVRKNFVATNLLAKALRCMAIVVCRVAIMPHHAASL